MPVFRSLTVLLLLSCSAMGQTEWCSIRGTITDSTGSALPGARVTVRTPATGFSRYVTTGRDGTYVMPNIPSGTVDLTMELAGFQTLTFTAVALDTGQIWTRDAQLPVATQNTTVEVRAEGVQLNHVNAEISDVIGSEQVSRIPVNGRLWQGLLMLAPGAVSTGTGDARGMRFLGRAGDDNTFRLDGVDATGIRNQVPRDDIRLAIPLDSIAEFRVRSGQYNAESGGNLGAQVDLVSRTGSNAFHGSVFEFFRNDKLDARTPFDPAKIRPFRLNQFGASLGGYLRRNRTFFFSNYEGLAQRWTRTMNGFVPTEAFRTRAAAASPTIGLLANAFPKATGATSSADIGSWSGPGSQNNDQHAGMARVDHRFTDKDLVFVRFSQTDMQVVTPRDLGYNNIVAESISNGALSYQKVVTPALVNEARVGVNRVPYHVFSDSQTIPIVAITGFTTLPARSESRVNSTSFTYADTLTWLRGKHTIKTGFEMRRVKMAWEVMVGDRNLNFQGPAALLAGELVSAAFTSSVPTHGVLKNQYFGFVQDEFKVSSRLSATIGLRYENFGVLAEEKGRAKPFNLETCGGYCPPGAPFTFRDNNNFAPRIGLAWSPKALGEKTVIRSGFGIYYGEGQLGNQLSPMENEPVRVQLSGATLRPLPLASLLTMEFPTAGTALTTAPLDLERRRKDMYSTQWSLGIQRALPQEFLAEVSYVGSKGTQLFQRTYANAINPATGVRPYPQFDLLRIRANGNDSSYHAMLLSLRRRTRAGLTMTANYQWAHSIDNGTPGGDDADYPQNINCRSCERANSSFDIRHNFAMNAVYELPFGQGRRFVRLPGVGGVLASGWELSGVGVARTGRPVNVTVTRPTSAVLDGNVTSPQRPDLVPGVSLTPDVQTPQRWLNLAAFAVPKPGTWGNAGRNIAIGPNSINLDLCLSKRTRLSERVTLDFRTEVFNVANNAKYANPLANISTPATFGMITALANTGATGTGTARQIQFGLRLDF